MDSHLQQFLSKVSDAGDMYRMELHWHKFQLLEVRCSASMSTPRTKRIAPKPGIDYLDPVLSVDGLPMHELGRRIGTAKSDFSPVAQNLETLIATLDSEGSNLQGPDRTKINV